jgi:hypothetical protein
MGGVKGERIFTAAYTVLNQDEEVRAHSLTQTKSLAFVKEMFERIVEGLRACNHALPRALYTDSPQCKHFISQRS